MSPPLPIDKVKKAASVVPADADPLTRPRAHSEARRKSQALLLQLKSDGSYSPTKKKKQEFPDLTKAPIAGLRARVFSWAETRWSKFEESYPMIAGDVEFLISGFELAIRSVPLFRFGFMAVWLGFRLIVYSILLLPAFLQVVAAYYHDPRITRRIPFGPNRRNYVDIYCPAEAVAAQQGKGPKVPVVIAVMGGAWVMGHRAWNAQLGLRLMDFGVLVFAVDYRNFPLGLVPEMVEDVGRALGWIFEEAAEAYGGDTSNMILLAQSAGAHLSALLLLERSLLEAREGKKEKSESDENDDSESEGAKEGPEAENGSRSAHLDTKWSIGSLKGFLLISGPYDLVALEPHLVTRGIYSRILYSLTVDGDLSGCSPTRILKTQDWRADKEAAVEQMPPIYLFHGGADKSVPSWSTQDFADALQDVGFNKLTVDLRPGMTHTYPVIEGPMAGKDPQVEIALPFLLGEEKAKDVLAKSSRSRMWPQIFLDIASIIMPY